jgi:hypothetical protein
MHIHLNYKRIYVRKEENCVGIISNILLEEPDNHNAFNKIHEWLTKFVMLLQASLLQALKFLKMNFSYI